VVASVYRLGVTPEEKVEAWPYLTPAYIHDALSFYHDHHPAVGRSRRDPIHRGEGAPHPGSLHSPTLPVKGRVRAAIGASPRESGVL
jgi:hypothetical protein